MMTIAQNRTVRFAAVVLLCAAVAACGKPPKKQAAAKVVKPLAANAIVVIFNHGTQRPQAEHKCDEEKDVPPVLLAVAEEVPIHIHYLCSKATDGDKQGSYTYKRAAEIEKVVDAYRKKGVSAKRIFIAGHSAGGWASLLASRLYGAKFNAVIAFAPAFAGPRDEVVKFPRWRNQIRPRQVSDLSYALRMDALVYGFRKDAYNRPRELRFLEKIPGVRLMPFDDCKATHQTTYSKCFSKAVTKQIAGFIRERSKAQTASR